MTTKLGGVTIADPLWDYEGYEKGAHDIGAAQEMIDGSIVYDYTGTRLAFVLRWVGLTAAERNAIWARYIIKTAQTFEPPDGGSYSVIVVPNSWLEAYIESDATPRYKVELSLETAAVLP